MRGLHGQESSCGVADNDGECMWCMGRVTEAWHCKGKHTQS